MLNEVVQSDSVSKLCLVLIVTLSSTLNPLFECVNYCVLGDSPMIFRSSEQKSDLRQSFYRPDRPFFAFGACHVLAHAFIETKGSEWRSVFIRPEAGFRGSHVFVSNRRLVFDYHGFSSEAVFIEHYFKKMRRFFPGWRASLVELTTSPIGEEFCNSFNHRRPDQFYEDPQPRALNFVHRHLKNTTHNLVK